MMIVSTCTCFYLIFNKSLSQFIFKDLTIYSSYFLLFTSYDMGTTIGMAYTNSICESSSYSIVKYNKFFDTTLAIAHELGHS